MKKEWGKDWGPGLQFFHCRICDNQWAERTRDCTSSSASDCQKCHEIVYPHDFERLYNWPVDIHGNLIEQKGIA